MGIRANTRSQMPGETLRINPDAMARAGPGNRRSRFHSLSAQTYRL